MPTFRQAPFLPRALRSLLDQQLPDWELLVVDDASPDETPTVLAPFLGDARIRALRLERNVGTGAALNLATSLARGRYIAYLPSDDVYFPEHLQRLVAHWRAPGRLPGLRGPAAGARHRGPTLQGGAVGRELARPPLPAGGGGTPQREPAGPGAGVPPQGVGGRCAGPPGRRPSPTAWRRTSGGPC